MKAHQRCLEVKNRNEPKQVMPKCQNLSRSLKIKIIWTFDILPPVLVIIIDINNGKDVIV